ncbi:hypothetical protein [Nocardia sp. NBC_01329]|uniref:hypothetical protein n=1 Tax=Nocardia sp. NBC_01329 TaxID=2903594 RepID=UPI002E128377|nr:hypothetical protein OG405_21635 [Nocardia sp. NBC_01329]
MKHRKPNRVGRAVASTSLPLATAAAMAIFASPAGAVPSDQPATPTTPAPAPSQPGTNEQQNGPETTPSQPGVQSDQERPESSPTPSPSQPGVTTPEKDGQNDQGLTGPTQPGVTSPRVAPLPVPGQPAPAQPAISPNTPQGQQPPAKPGDAPAASPDTEGENAEPGAPQTDALVAPQSPQWQAPSLDEAPVAPVVEMQGPHTEIGAALDGGSLAPGHFANTHHFSNQAGYVGTAGFRTPTGTGEAGISVEFVDENTINVSTFTGGNGLPDNRLDHVIDTTPVNTAKAAVEHWIVQQPGGAAALDAVAKIPPPPPLLPPGNYPEQGLNVGGVNTQWGGSLQY